MSLSRYAAVVVTALVAAAPPTAAAAAPVSGADVYAAALDCYRTAGEMLSSADILLPELPQFVETDLRPIHAYQMQLAASERIYRAELAHNIRPIPLVHATPITYVPEDVKMIVDLNLEHLQKLARKKGLELPEATRPRGARTASDVFRLSALVFYQLDALSGMAKIETSEVYAEFVRARDDLKNTLSTLARRETTDKARKRLIMSAVHGTHPDGTHLKRPTEDTSARDVLAVALKIRNGVNVFRGQHNMELLKVPVIADFETISPRDVVIQAQIVIADLNTVKVPLQLAHSTASAIEVTDKTSTDVLVVANHILYMLDRLIDTTGNS